MEPGSPALQADSLPSEPSPKYGKTNPDNRNKLPSSIDETIEAEDLPTSELGLPWWASG